jgi:hypothetical protein
MTDEHCSVSAAQLFDEKWYMARYPDVCAAGLDPLTHWLNYGWREARQPNPYFDPVFYLSNNPDVTTADLNPLQHYASSGDYSGKEPSPNFNPSWYRIAYGIPSSTPAMLHFFQDGLHQGLLPTAHLYAVPLMGQYRPYRDIGQDPFAAAILSASASDRPLRPDHIVISASKLLDTNFYLMNSADVQEADVDPLCHFCQSGWREGRRPNIYFDPNWYLETNPEVRRLGINPLTHYVLEGEAAGRRPIAYFDPVWYRDAYRLGSHEIALAHYLAHRRSQSFSPNPLFDVSWYLSVHHLEIGVDHDPFLHFLRASTLADVDPSPNFSSAEYRRRHLGWLSLSESCTPLIHYLLYHYVNLVSYQGN